jgi:hypothetical protein
MTEISELEASTKRTHSSTASSTDNLKPTIKEDVIHGNDFDEEEDDYDGFDVCAIKEPRLSSSTVPIVVVVSNAHKTARFYTNSEDPLFQGVCLYSTKTEKKTDVAAPHTTLFMPRMDTPSDSPESLDLWDQWYFPSVFRSLWQRGQGWQSKRKIEMDSE